MHNWAIGFAAAEGGAAGAAGLPGVAVDIPTVIVLALRTIHKIGVCYGFEVKTKLDKEFVLAILAASGANEMGEKLAALTTLRTIEVAIAKQTWKQLGQKAAANQMGKEAGIIGIKSLAKQLGINLSRSERLCRPSLRLVQSLEHLRTAGTSKRLGGPQGVHSKKNGLSKTRRLSKYEV